MTDELDPEIKRAVDWMKKASSAKAPAGLDTRIINRLKAAEKKQARRPWLWGLSGGLATAVVVMLAILVTRPTPPPAQNMAMKRKNYEAAADKAAPLEEKTVDGRASALMGSTRAKLGKAVPYTQVIRRAEEWAQLPQRGTRVDFSKDMVLLVYGKIVSHNIEDGKLLVWYSRATDASMVTDFIVVPAFDGPIQFLAIN